MSLVPTSAAIPTQPQQLYESTQTIGNAFYNIRLKTIGADLATASPGEVTWAIPAFHGQVCLLEPLAAWLR